MENEISASVSLSVSKGGVSVNNSASRTATMSGDQMLSNVQIIGASAEALVLGDVATVGYVFIKNLEDQARFFDGGLGELQLRLRSDEHAELVWQDALARPCRYPRSNCLDFFALVG